jgi:hypothetical protein
MSLRFACFLCPVWVIVSCAATIPKAELDRCDLGVADGNDAFQPRQATACRMIAERLTADERPIDAAGYARKACALEDARGCDQYIALVRGQPLLRVDELPRARAAGEKACAGMVIANDGVDARPGICARTAELYLDLAPRSPTDAGRLFARACKLGDAGSCAHAKALGAGVEENAVTSAHERRSRVAPTPQAMPPPAAVPPTRPTAIASAPARPVPVCHEMRACVALDVEQHNATEVVGSIHNGCDRTVKCTFCPARGDQVDKWSCRSTTLVPNESKAGRESGLWYDGYNSIAYDCVDVGDDGVCLGT